jgi:hypothetical protein
VSAQVIRFRDNGKAVEVEFTGNVAIAGYKVVTVLSASTGRAGTRASRVVPFR